ncbi:YpbF family protein [Heyndrickxia acidicola]|uniref:YpbF family protein n=1 Tax=Heyndrickxia acidicola TaxID=209389 RepID=A0ABU6MLR1_9BACI|nr:YpbF family protein [Heyndrickxia acidicola]MED1204906.1 YpbF family protein [Heyndrickxia acidicola]
MEQNIAMLNQYTDQTTKQMLQNLVSRKKKFERYKKRHLLLLWTSVFYSFACLYLLYHTVLEPYSYSFGEIFMVFAGQFKHALFLLSAAGLWGATKILYDKKQKTESEYHALRCEIIDKSKDLWKNEAWKERHLVFEMMKKKYDINLFHQSK